MKLQKQLSLLKTAQNEAFVSLVCENIKIELKQKPWKIMKILNFLTNDLQKSNYDFTRLKVSEGLIPAINESFDFNSDQLSALISHLNLIPDPQKRQKAMTQFENSMMTINLQSQVDLEYEIQERFKYFSYSDLLQYNKNFFFDLIQKYQPLLSELNISDSLPQNGNKDSIKQMFMENALGGRLGTDKLKLSDFIDESFFEDLDDNNYQVSSLNNNKDKIPIRTLVSSLKQFSQKQIINIGALSNKRIKKNEAKDSSKPTHIILSPLLSLLVSCLNTMMVEDWKMRQSSCSVIRQILLMQNLKSNLYYSKIGIDQENKLQEIDRVQINVNPIIEAIVGQSIIVILKDQFNDFEELKVLAPVRDECIVLISQLPDILQESEKEIQFVVQTLPVVLKSIEHENWISKYNFFLIIKALIKSQRTQLFLMFNRVLIESLLNMEHEVKIIVTDIINQLFQLYLEQADAYKNISLLLTNLKESLKQSDEIESSAISVFSLINKIIDLVPDLGKLQFDVDLSVFCPFNFHKVINVRYSYNQIINKCLQYEIFQSDELIILGRLTFQALAMERSKSLVKLLQTNLKLIIQNMCKNGVELEFIQSFFNYDYFLHTLYSYQLQSFDNFLFYESKNMESTQNDYFQIVYRPVTDEELTTFYQGKQKNLIKAIGIMMSHNSYHGCVQIINIMEQTLLPDERFDLNDCNTVIPLHENHFIYLMCISYMINNLNTNDDIKTLMKEVGNRLINSYNCQITEENISLSRFRDIQLLYNLLNSLWTNITKHQQNHLLQHLEMIFQLLEQATQLDRLVNLQLIDDQLKFLMQGIAFLQDIPEIYECFSDITAIFASLSKYGLDLSTRIKSVSVIITIQMIQNEMTTLPSQLNNLIKPLLNQVKTERVEYIQAFCSKYLIKLIALLQSKGKAKPAQQIVTVILKDIESEIDDINNKGNIQCFKYLIKYFKNILAVNSNQLLTYLCQNVSNDNVYTYEKVALFTFQQLQCEQAETANEIYQEFQEQVTTQICNCIRISISETIPQLVLLVFSLFKHQQQLLILEMVQMMKNKQKQGFDCLKILLDQQNAASSDIIKYIPVFILPVIQSIQYSRIIYNSDKQITLILAQLLQLLPLNMAQLTDPSNFDKFHPSVRQLAIEGSQFLQVFIHTENQNVKAYEIEIKVNAKLRDYQMQGITWLAELGKYNLNCALCDDMGLGKTLQSLCVVLNESYKKKQTLQKGQEVVNLIVCPTTITHNWHSEVKKFFGGEFKSVVYEGTPNWRQDIIKNHKNYDIIIVSYEKLRNDLNSFKDIDFYYGILDEAHIIKNPKAKTTQSVKQIKCERKIILTGTPLQNRVSELWSIFDYLMPGFLEEEGIFNKKYNQYLTSNIKKLSEKLEETQSFLDALKSLKKRIAPFILRRTKQDVLKELPPKIIQDVICQMTSFQEYMHSLAEKNNPISQQISQSSGQTGQSGQPKQGKQILQNLILHRKVCNHPIFAIEGFRNDKNILKYLKQKSEKELSAYEYSGKLLGLYEKLVECEIIQKEESGLGLHKSTSLHREESKTGDDFVSSGENQFVNMAQVALDSQAKLTNNKHRVLIFCQMSSFMKMITEQILQKFNIKYMELLSRHSSKERVEIVDQFNSDDSVRVLILTTAVGGLGLNLTGADTVIFAEHDWNPMKDLQAIDRAHRIGQTRQVNVYRLIVKDTLEEKIMNLQRFKENLARSLVQSKGAATEDASQGLEMNDILNSFQEHSAFATVENNRMAQLKIDDKIINGIEEIWQGGAFMEEM